MLLYKKINSKCEISIVQIKTNLCSRGRRPAGKKGEGKAPRTHQVMGLNPWEVITPKMGNPDSDFGLIGFSKGDPDTVGSK